MPKEIESLWKKALENGKLLASSIMVFSALMVGAWTLATDIFLTRADAQVKIEKLDIESSYNKAFRLETKISNYNDITKKRPLTKDEQRILERLKRDLKRTDLHIDKIEKHVYGEEK